MKKPILVSLILLNLHLKALMLEAKLPAGPADSFHLLITLLEKKYSSPVYTKILLVTKNVLWFPLFCYLK